MSIDRPQDKSPEVQKHADFGVDVKLISLEVTADAYVALMTKVDAKYNNANRNMFAGNLFKKYVKGEMLKYGKDSVHQIMPEIERNFLEFNKMYDTLVKNKNVDSFAKILGIKMSPASAERLSEQARTSGISNPEQMAIIKLYAIVQGVNGVLEDEYERYIAALFLPDVTEKFNELV